MFILLSLFSIFFAQNPLPNLDSLAHKVNHFMDKQTEKRFNGVVLISQKDHIIFEKNQKLLSFSEPIKENSQFVIASLSKQITAALILKACDEKKISLNMPLSSFVKDKKKSFLQNITLHHLLSHTSGLDDKLEKPLKYPVGEKFDYQNLNYILLGKILEKIYHKPYNVIANRFFQKIGMKNSFALSHIKTKKNQRKKKNLVWGYMQKDSSILKREILNPINFNPTGGLVSTAKDLLNWNLTLHEDSTFLSSESKKNMLSAYSVRKYRFGDLNYGYGIHISNLENIKEIFHAGYIDGYISSLFYYPEKQISLIILENYSGTDQHPSTYIVHDQIRNLVRKELLK